MRKEANMTAIKSIFIHIMISMLFTGWCLATANAQENLRFNPVISKQQKKDADLEDIIITFDTEEARLGTFYFDIEPFTIAFMASLQESIIRSAIFNDLSNHKIALLVQVRKVQLRNAESIISYELIDKNTGRNFYLQYFVVSQEKTKNTSSSERMIKSVENNIRQFLTSLKNSEIAWPGTVKKSKSGKTSFFSTSKNDDEPEKTSADDDGKSFWQR